MIKKHTTCTFGISSIYNLVFVIEDDYFLLSRINLYANQFLLYMLLLGMDGDIGDHREVENSTLK